MFQIIPNNAIDQFKWDTLVRSDSAAYTSNYSWYLNELCQWDLIVWGEYQGGMAIASKNQFGFKRAYQPPFVQLYQWVGANVDIVELANFIQKQYADIRMNTALNIAGATERTNYILPLDRPADSLFEGFSKSLRKNIRKATEQGLEIRTTSSCALSLKFYREVHGSNNPQLGSTQYEAFARLFKRAASLKLAFSKEVYLNQLPIASLSFMISKDRFHYVLGAPNADGKKHNALSLALWQLIEENAGKSMKLDFEGSSIPAVADFYKSFGSEKVCFYEYISTPNSLFNLLRKLV